MHKLYILIPTLLVLSLFASCANIATIKKNPTQYHGRSLTLEGVITKAFSVPLMPITIYEIYDNTGFLTVVSMKKTVYRQNERPQFTGRIYYLDPDQVNDVSDELVASISDQLKSLNIPGIDKNRDNASYILKFLLSVLRDRTMDLVLLEE